LKPSDERLLPGLGGLVHHLDAGDQIGFVLQNRTESHQVLCFYSY
jgi:hypothetical protein